MLRKITKMHKTAMGMVLCLSLVCAMLAGCSGGASTTTSADQVFEVKRGNLDIIVSTDGMLTMPNQYELKFGVQGQVDQILVEEGETIKQGAMLAMLDSKAQRNAIKSALFNIQTARNSSLNASCNADHLPYNYPDLSIVRMVDEATGDIDRSVGYFKEGNYKDAGYWLAMTYFDIQICEDLISERPNAASLAGAKSNDIYYPDVNAGNMVPLSDYNAGVISSLQEYRGKLLGISQQLKLGKYSEAALEFDAAQQMMSTISQLAKSTVYLKDRMVFEYPDTSASDDFLQASIRNLQELDDYLSRADADPVEAAKKLYIAKLNLLVGKDVLENQTLIFDTMFGSNWKAMQQNNLSLQSAELALYRAKQDIMKTVILSPSDGTVVSVNLKKSSVLSAQDYSARSAVSLVDTSSVQFEGMVDEIDIMKVQPGQEVKITMDAIPGKVLTGRVKFISPFGVTSGQVIKFAVTIKLDPTDAPIRGGLSATAEITTYSARDVLLIPVSVVANMPSGGHAVAVINPATGQPEFRQVTIGQQTFQYAEVLSGLMEGEKVTFPRLPTTTSGTSGIPGGMPGTARPMR